MLHDPVTAPVHHTLRLLVALATFLTPAAAHALTLLQTDRSVLTSTFIDLSGVDSDGAASGFESQDAGRFIDAAVDGVGFGDLVVATGEATQDSSISIAPLASLAVDAGGAAGGLFDVQDPGFPSRATSLSTSEFGLVFEVATPRPYLLAAALSAELIELTDFSTDASSLGEALAVVQLTGESSGAVFSLSAIDGSADGLAVSASEVARGVLVPDTYVFEIVASTNLRGFEDASGFATAGYGVQFTIVPEPSVATCMALGLVWLTRRPARSR